MADLVPNIPSREVTISAANITEQRAMAGGTVTATLLCDLNSPGDGKIIAASSETITLDANGSGSFKTLPCWDGKVTDHTGSTNWGIVITCSWHPRQRLIRVPVGTQPIALGLIPEVRPLRGREIKYALTAASVSVIQNATITEASGTISVDGGMLTLALKLPPAKFAIIALQAGQNADDLQQDGEYEVRSDRPVLGLPVYPATGRLSVTNHATGIAQQQFTSWHKDTPGMWLRSLNSGVWSPWVVVAGAAPVQLIRTGDNFTLTFQLDGKPLITYATLRDATRNGAANINHTTYAYTTMHGAATGDEVPPVWLRVNPSNVPQYVGGNHALTSVLATFTNPDGKTTADLGSVWTDGTRDYTITDVDASRVTMLGKHTTDAKGVNLTATVNPSGPLTHKSGATRTGAIDHTTRTVAVYYGWKIPEGVSLWADGEAVTKDTSVGVKTVELREVYSVPDPGSLWDVLTANPGKDWRTLPVKGAIRVENRHRWTGGGKCDVTQTVTETMPCYLGNVSGLQSVALARAGFAATRYLPGTKTINGHTWATGQSLDVTFPVADTVTTSTLLDPAAPPVFSLDVASDPSKAFGFDGLAFAMGYYPDAGASSDNTPRIANTPTRLWENSAAKKSYPAAHAGGNPGWGKVTVRGFRLYMTKARADQVTSVITSSGGDATRSWVALATMGGL